MTNENTTYRTKANAVFFAAIMVVSMLAAGFAVAPAAAATNDVKYVDDAGDSTEIFFQGQDAYVVGDDLSGATPGDTVNLRRVESFNDSSAVDSSSQVEQLTVEDEADAAPPSAVNASNPNTNVVVIDTSDLSAGDYFVRGAGSLPNNPGEADTFEITIQSLSTEFADDQVTDEGSNAETDLDITSDRGSYSLNVSADGDLSDEELFNIFAPGTDYSTATSNAFTEDTPGTGYGPFNAGVYQSSEEDNDEKIVLYNIDDREETVNFTDIDADDYEFDFNVTDTESSDAASITVAELDRQADFTESVYTQTAGDVVEMTVELDDTDDAWIQLGSEESGFVDILYVNDDDEDGEVTFEVNTRTVGTNVPKSVVYNTEDDVVDSEMYGGLGSNSVDYQTEDGAPIGGTNNFEQYLKDIGQIGNTDGKYDQLARPLQPTTYDVAVNGNNVFVVNDDDESELDNEIGLTTLDLTQPGVDNVQTWTAPSNSADDTSNVSEVLNTVTQSSDIALDDQLVVQAEATGIYGHMVALDPDGFDALDDGFEARTLYELDQLTGEGVNIQIEADDATGNQDPTSVNLNNANEDEVFVIVDQESGQMFIVVDTSANNAFSQSVDDDSDFTAEIEYEADDEDQFEFDDPADTADDSGFTVGDAALGGANSDNTVAAYPYFAAGEDNTESASTDFTLSEREATFDNENSNDQIEISISEEATVSGTTNVAPGSDVSVRVQSDSGVSPSFVETADAEISDDGSFTSELDLSGASVDDTATVSFRVAGSSVSDADALLVEEVQSSATFTVSDLSPSEATVTVGDTIDASATIENTGEQEATQTVEFRVDGNAVASEDVTLAGGESTTFETSVDTSDLEPGDYEHSVATDDDEVTGSLTVEAADDSGSDDSGSDDSGSDDSGSDDSGSDDSGSDDSGSDDSGSDDSGSDDSGSEDGTPGFGAIVALVALIAAALLATRRNE